MKIDTRNFGEIEIEDDRIVTFADGIPGFPMYKRYALLLQKPDEQEEITFCWLQCIDDGDVAFMLLDTLSVIEDYNPIVNDEELECIGGFDPENSVVYNVVVVPENVEDMRVNLKAPIVINVNAKKGKQVIVNNDDYPIRYYIYKELKKRAGEQ